MKKVYFFGAGASKASIFEFPTMRGFFRGEDLKLQQYDQLRDLIYELFPNTPVDELNLEEMVSHLDLTLDDLGKRGLVEGIDSFQAQTQLMEYIVHRLKLPDDPLKAVDPTHKQLLTLLGPEDSLLTLNYDEVLDYALYDLSPKSQDGSLSHDSMLDRSYFLLQDTHLIDGDWPTLYHGEKGLGLYLKLHGSISWLYCPNPSCGNHQQFFPARVDWKIKPQKGEPCSRCGSSLEIVIVPPSVSKSFSRFPKLGFLWRLAYEELVQADRIVLIGMSIPESDFNLRWLFRETSRRRGKPVGLEIVNKDPNVIKKAESLFPKVSSVEGFLDLGSYVKQKDNERDS